MNMLREAALAAGFGGGLVVDYPWSERSKKLFLVLVAPTRLPTAPGASAAAGGGAARSGGGGGHLSHINVSLADCVLTTCLMLSHVIHVYICIQYYYYTSPSTYHKAG